MLPNEFEERLQCRRAYEDITQGDPAARNSSEQHRWWCFRVEGNSLDTRFQTRLAPAPQMQPYIEDSDTYNAGKKWTETNGDRHKGSALSDRLLSFDCWI
eukprot:Seg10058.2 transcript_id=Seg10058.2/GoldUCD/mRNA.D3Y31 product="hypothetical protein" protein_id=Seg10058.2/GoldUCD/D3Y31